LSGGPGRDDVRGAAGNDLLRAGSGRDVIRGGAGADTLIARDNAPYDSLDGGLGTNLCIADASDARVRCEHPWAANHRAGVPILAERGWAGTLNLAISHFNQNGWGLTTTMVKRMINQGWEVDSHTMSHPVLPGLSSAALDYQVSASRSLLRRTFRIPVNFF